MTFPVQSFYWPPNSIENATQANYDSGSDDDATAEKRLKPEDDDSDDLGEDDDCNFTVRPIAAVLLCVRETDLKENCIAIFQ